MMGLGILSSGSDNVFYLNYWLTRSFLLNPKYNDTVPLCLKIREAMDGNGTGDIWGTTVRNKRVFFLNEVASSKLNLHGAFFRK